MSARLTRFRAWLAADTPALPVDLFRVLVGLLSVGYFIRLLLETPDFSSPTGLLDHAYLSRVLWFTRWSLFQPGMGGWTFYLAYATGVACGLALVAGARPRLAAGVAFLIAASHTRWNFVVFSIDDGLMHLCLCWVVLLPVGRTLILRELWRRRGAALRQWADVLVPGTAVRCLLGNVLLVYVTAGLCKLGSEYWRSGFALYAILRQPIAWAPDWWSPADLPWLRVASYGALLTELTLPWLITRPAGSPWKRVGLVLMLGFHAGIILTLRVPCANLALGATAVLFVRDELTVWIRHRLGAPLAGPRPVAVVRLRWADRCAVALLGLLGLAMLRGIPAIGEVHRPAYAVLWMAGLAQDYHLFGWIDQINYHASSRARLSGESRDVPVDPVLPSGMRYTLLQAYLHDVPWMLFPRNRRSEFTALVRARLEARACARAPWRGTLEIVTTMARITPGDPELLRGQPEPPLRLRCGTTVALTPGG